MLTFVSVIGLLVMFAEFPSSPTVFAVQDYREANSVVIGPLDVGEYIGAETPVLTGEHIAGLRNGQITTAQGRTEYSQSLRLQKQGLLRGGVVTFEEGDGSPQDYLLFENGVYGYEVSFSPGLASRVRNNRLIDLHDRTLFLLGMPWVILDSYVDLESRKIALRLIGGSLWDVMDDDFTDLSFLQNARVNNEVVPAMARIRATQSGDIIRISSIEYSPRVLDTRYVEEGHGIMDELRYPQSMLSPQLDIFYGGLRQTRRPVEARVPQPKTNPVLFRPTDSGYNLQFTNNQGREYIVPLLESRGGLHYGENGRQLHFAEQAGFFVQRGDYVVLTSRQDVNAVTSVLQLDHVDSTNNIVTFSDMAGGNPQATFSGGSGQLFVAGNAYRFTTDGAGVAIDLNNDGSVGSGAVDIRLRGGAFLNLNPVAGDSVSISYVVPRRLFEEARSGETVTFSFKENGRLDVAGVSGVETFRDRQGVDVGLTSFGAQVFIDSRRHPQMAGIGAPERQVHPSVSIGGGQRQGFIVVTLERDKLTG